VSSARNYGPQQKATNFTEKNGIKMGQQKAGRRKDMILMQHSNQRVEGKAHPLLSPMVKIKNG